MIQPIYLYGSEVLRKVAAPADLADREGLKTLVQDLWDTLEKSDGCGLAAPQIGVSLRVAVVNGDVMKDVYPYLEGFRRAFINPVVLEESEKMCEYNEGCLSVPGVYADVKKTETFDKFAARMIQHEFSHLDGELFTDLVAPIRRKMLTKKLQNIAHGKVGTAYKAKIK